MWWLRSKNWLWEEIRYFKVKESLVILTLILNSSTQYVSDAIISSKLKYYVRLANKLNYPKTAPNTYWKILKTITNGTKILLIPPLLVGNQVVSDFVVKASLFNEYFK